jgi:copper chaperone CopZ
VQSALEKVKGVKEADVSLANQEAMVKYDPDAAKVEDLIKGTPLATVVTGAFDEVNAGHRGQAADLSIGADPNGNHDWSELRAFFRHSSHRWPICDLWEYVVIVSECARV